MAESFNTRPYMKRLKEAQEDRDTESAHADADEVLCDLLEALGYKKVVEAYRKVSKWYA